jgi:hypothetical protein
MEQHDHSEEPKQDLENTEGGAPEQAQDDAVPNRRSFLTRAAIGVAGAAGIIAMSSQTGMATESGAVTTAKSKILERIRLQMAAQDIVPIDNGGDGGGDTGDGVYMKNAHALYLKK